jgi:hypothetical protein
MERASRLIRKLALPGDALSPEQLARTAWPLAVGKKIAAHTRPVRMVRTRLVVEVEDEVWQRQLFALTRQVVANLDKALGRGMVEDIEFRMVPPRREPQKAVASTSAGALFDDEADRIADPVLRVIYKTSRKRSLA